MSRRNLRGTATSQKWRSRGHGKLPLALFAFLDYHSPTSVTSARKERCACPWAAAFWNR